MISLIPHATLAPIQITPEEYKQMVAQKQYGWTVCQSHTEWLAKLHYLREGHRAGKIQEAAFYEKETALILNWWRRFV